MTLRGLLAVPLLAVALVAPAAAGGMSIALPPDPNLLGSTAGATKISALQGWVVWSEPVEGTSQWRLVAAHDGNTAPVAGVAPRAEPFDVDLGTDADGAVVATFSRCAIDPEPQLGRLAKGCRLRVLDLDTGRERALAVPRPAGVSDTVPSMWRGRVAFARQAKPQPRISQVLLWSPADRRLTSLPKGTVSAGCRRRPCTTATRGTGTATSMDLGPSFVTFRWYLTGPDVPGHGGWEVRADRLDGRRSALLGTGVSGESCVGASRTPGRPVLSGGKVWFSSTDGDCTEVDTEIRRADPVTRRVDAGPLPNTVLSVAPDGGVLYGIVAALDTPLPGTATPDNLTCSPPYPVCSVRRLEVPALEPVHQRLRPPLVR